MVLIVRTKCLKCNLTGVKLFCLPKDVERMKTWMEHLELEYLLKEHDQVYLKNNARVCFQHFDDRAFTGSFKTNLSKFAVPIDLRRTASPSSSSSSSVFSPSSEVNITNGECTDSFLVCEEPHLPLPSTPVHLRKNERRIETTPKTREISRLRNKVSRMQRRMVINKRDAAVLSKVEGALPLKQYEFVLSQINAGKRKPQGRRWSTKEKAIAYSIFMQSPSTYRLLRKFLAFPCKTTLRKSLGNVAKDEGFCPILFSAISEKVKQMKEADRLCTLVFDEMSIKSHLTYNADLDVVDGFESAERDDGCPQQAEQALVFMIRGITQPWKQAIAYYFKAKSAPEGWFKNTVLTVLDKVETTGLQVMAIVCDQGGPNRGLFSSLGVSKENPFFYKGERKIFAMYDMPHLLKSVRNNLMKFDHLRFIHPEFGKEMRASWKDIRDLYEKDSNERFRVLPKLTKSHVNARGLDSMKVKYAAQVFSHSVAACLNVYISHGICPRATHTAEFVDQMDQLFDSMNAKSEVSSKDMACAVSSSSQHVEKWKKWHAEVYGSLVYYIL